MSTNPPLVAERILDAAAAIAVCLVRRLLNRLSPSFNRALVHRVHVLHVQIEHGRFWCPLVAGLANHQHRVAHAHLGMADSALVVFVTKGFLAAKGVLQEIDLRLRVRHHQVGRHRVVAVWNWFDCHDFFSSPS
jgi:hypothetical protein